MTRPTEWQSSRRALIVATPRSGSTHLCHLLDSHPDIFCVRGEPFLPGSVWDKIGLTNKQRWGIIYGQSGYEVTACKMTYRQFVRYPADFWQRMGIERVIHLTRDNVVRGVYSAMLNTMAGRGEIAHPTHTYATPEPLRVQLDVEAFLAEAYRYKASVSAMRRHLADCQFTFLYNATYEEHVIEETGHSRLLAFLGVMERRLVSRLARVNPGAMSENVVNWEELRYALAESEFREWIDT